MLKITAIFRLYLTKFFKIISLYFLYIYFGLINLCLMVEKVVKNRCLPKFLIQLSDTYERNIQDI